MTIKIMFYKSKKLFFTFFLVFVFLNAFFWMASVKITQAQDDSGKACPCGPVESAGNRNIRLQIAIPGITDTCTYKVKTIQNGAEGDIEKQCHYVESNLPAFIQKAYSFSIGLIAIMAVIMIMIGGVKWILAAGNPGSIGDAQKTITAAVSGLVLALLSYAILNTINPNLTNLQMTNVQPVGRIEQSMHQCKYLADGSIVVREGGAEFTIIHDNTGALIDNSGWLACQTQYRIKDERFGTNEEKTCFGSFCDTGVCLNVAYNLYQCSEGYWSGLLSYEKDSWVTEIKLAGSCEGSDDYVALENHAVTFEDPKNTFFYAVIKDTNYLRPNCGGGTEQENTRRGRFFLLTLVHRGFGQVNDWYAVDKNCQLIKGDKDSNNDDPGKIKWSTIDRSKLLTYDELIKYHTCDLHIDSNFRSR